MRHLIRCFPSDGPSPHYGIGNRHRPHPPQGFLEPYGHGNPVHFRSVLIHPLGEYDQP